MNLKYIQTLAVFAMLLNACGNKAIPIAEPAQAVATTTNPTFTPDPCAGENLVTSMKEVNNLTREFDDTFKLARNLPIAQTPAYISEMQRLQREAEDQTFPPCLSTLKNHQLIFMSTSIDTMIAFVAGADSNTLNNGLAQAQKEHDLYTLELAGLLGIQSAPNATTTP